MRSPTDIGAGLWRAAGYIRSSSRPFETMIGLQSFHNQLRRRQATERYLVSVILAWVVSCSTGGSHIATIPKQALNGDDEQRLMTFNYDPEQIPMRWSSPDELIIAHLARYSSHDVYSATCAGSGVYAIDLSTGASQPLAVGGSVCTALGHRNDGLSLHPSRLLLAYVGYEDINRWPLRLADLEAGSDRPFPGLCHTRAASDPAWAPDGAGLAVKVLCDADPAGGYIYLVDTVGATFRRLTDAQEVVEYHPSYDPTGTRIAWESYDEKPSITRIMVKEVGGGPPTHVARGGRPSWSPDGKWIAYYGPDSSARTAAIRVVRPEGSDDRRVWVNRTRTTLSRGWGPFPEGEPAGPLLWSPDSRKIAFGRRFDEGTVIWIVSLDGELRRVTRADH